MGIFGSRTKTQVGTNVSRVMEDSTLPNSIITGALMAGQQGDGQMVEHATEELANGLGMRIHRLYDYAKKHYTHGLPSGTTMDNLLGKPTIIQAIQAELGMPIGLDYYYVGPLNFTHLGWHLLVKDHVYNSVDNSLMYNGQKVFLTDLQPVVIDATVAEKESGSMDLWGISPTSGVTPLRPLPAVEDYDVDRPVFVIDPSATSDHLLVKYCYEVDYIKVVEGINVPSKRVESGEFTMSVAGWNMGASYHQAGYRANEKRGFWLYAMGSNANMAIEAIFDASVEPGGTFFPMVYFRFDKKAITEADPEFATSEKMLNIINMKFDDVAQAINENPDIADVEQAFMTFAVPAETTAPVEQRYLFDFFNNLWTGAQLDHVGDTMPLLRGILGGEINEQRKRTIIIQDKKFKLALSWDSIIKRRLTGNIAKIGKYNSVAGHKDDTQVAIDVAGMHIEVNTGTPSHRYQRQITANVYEEIQVMGLSMTYYVWGDYTTTGDDNNEDILLIPLDYAITSRYSLKDRELLYARSMHYVFNSRVVTKLKWYQSGIFKVVLVIIAIVITVITKGAAFKLIAAAWAAGGVVAVMYVIIPMLIKYLIVSLVIRKVVQIIGIKAAFVIAVLAAVAGYYQMAVSEGGVASAPFASELLTVSTNLTSAIGSELKAEYRELTNEYKTFEEYSKEKIEALDKVNASLDGQLHLVPMIIWGETPSDFYQRTVHSGNIGIVGIDVVESFVDSALMLPKLTDTLGDLYV